MEYWLQVFQNVLRTPGCAGHLHAPHTLPISCQYIHTLTQTTIKNWTYGLKFCMYSSYPSCTTHTAHKWRTPIHLLAASTCSCCKHHDHQPKKHWNKNRKMRRGSRTLVYTLPCTSLNRRTKHKLSNLPRSLTTITNIQTHSRGSGTGT